MAEPTPRGLTAERARRVRLVVLDVDGVMTDGGIYLGATRGGERFELKRFDITDGMGTLLLQMAGVEVAILTGRESEAVRMRAQELRVQECLQHHWGGKLALMQELLERRGFAWEQVAFLGDDLVDLPILRRVGLPAAVGNATAEVRALALWVGEKHGGRGAVREFAEALLTARGEWPALVERYVAEREAGVGS